LHYRNFSLVEVSSNSVGERRWWERHQQC